MTYDELLVELSDQIEAMGLKVYGLPDPSLPPYVPCIDEHGHIVYVVMSD